MTVQNVSIISNWEKIKKISNWDTVFPEACLKITVERVGVLARKEAKGSKHPYCYTYLKDSHRTGSGMISHCSRSL